MTTEPILDIENLCQPVSDANPAGPYWREDEQCREILYPQVDSAFDEARKKQRKKASASLFPEDSIERRNIEEPDWNAVIRTAQNFLQHSKDLWVAAWLMEALAREHGFAGLRDGMTLVHKLCTTYWDSIHPRPDEIDGIRRTTAQMNGDVLAELITHLPITKGGKDGLTTEDYDKSAEMDGLKSDADRQDYRRLGVISTAEFEGKIRDSGKDFLQNLVDDAQAAREQFDLLTEFLDEKCGQDAPASSKVKDNFDETLRLIRDLAGPFLPKDEATVEEDQGDPRGVNESSTQRLAASSPVWDRDLAFREVARMAEQFAKYEPNSPVASILRQAVSIGKLSWEEMLSKLLPSDEDSLREILKQTGGRREEPEQGAD